MHQNLVLLDTNLLLLLIVGDTRVDYIEKHKRTRTFTEDNYLELSKLIKDCVLTTVPHVLAETSNLLKIGAHGALLQELLQTFKQFVKDYEEQQIESKVGVDIAFFNYLGLTDAILIIAASSGATLITMDGPLHRAALGKGLSSIHFVEFIDQS
jgi:rRNA-processing protein FCF1